MLGFLNKLLDRQVEARRDTPGGPLFIWWREGQESSYIEIKPEESFLLLMEISEYRSEFRWPKWAHREIRKEIVKIFENEVVVSKRESLGYGNQRDHTQIPLWAWLLLGSPSDDCR